MKTINDYTLNEIMANIDLSKVKDHILPLREDIQEIAINLIKKLNTIRPAIEIKDQNDLSNTCNKFIEEDINK